MPTKAPDPPRRQSIVNTLKSCLPNPRLVRAAALFGDQTLDIYVIVKLVTTGATLLAPLIISRSSGTL